MKKAQHGFGIIEILIIIVVIGILGAVGWVIYDRQQNHSEPTSQQQPAPEITEPKVSYLVVEEWGVKIPQPEGVEIEYEINATFNNSAQFASSEQKALGGNCGAFSHSRFSVTWRSKDYVSTDGMEQAGMRNAEENDRTVEMGDRIYYIYYSLGGGVCNDELEPQAHIAISAEEEAANDNLLAALRGITMAE